MNAIQESKQPICSQVEHFSTPTKANKFVFSHSGMLSATEQVNGSFRRFNTIEEKYDNKQRTPSRHYYETPNFSFAQSRDPDTDKQFGCSSSALHGSKIHERLSAKAKSNSSPYERLVAPLRIHNSQSSTMDSHEVHGKYFKLAPI